MADTPASTPWTQRREGWQAQSEDARSPADIDYARIIHSASFRRLQGKTQILSLGDSDFYRTRLTHSLEVAQIAGGIARQLATDAPDHPAAPLLPALAQIQAAGATHDLGHPPFGHGGEVALNYCMRDAGGFEGNGQTLRIVARLEKFSARAGANLTRRSLLAVLKYPVAFSAVANPALRPRLAAGPTTLSLIDRAASKPPKCYLDSEAEVVDWLLAPLSADDREAFTGFDAGEGRHGRARHKSFDCTIMDTADDIAFAVHDLEDALALGLMGEGDLRAYLTEGICVPLLDRLKAKYPGESANDVHDSLIRGLCGDGATRKRWIGRLVHHFLTHCRFVAAPGFAEPLLAWRVGLAGAVQPLLAALKQAVMERVILSPAVQQLEFKGQRMVVAVFEAMASEPAALLPRDTYARLVAADGDVRVICDHIAGMTDGFLLKSWERLFAPRMGSVFDRF